MAMSFKGYGEVHQGNFQVGLALLDEAAAAATSGQLDLRIASDILCNTIAACRNIGDLKRAGQWADEGERWMRRQSVGGYPGICRVHRAELKMLRGQWPEAELEARQACEELQRFGLNDGLGYAHHEIGEIRLRMGDLQGAADAFERAYELGDDGQPGLALLHLARGERRGRLAVDRAVAGRDAGMHEGPVDQATRGRLLPAAIDIALARRRHRDGTRRRRRARVDRGRVQATALRGGRADGQGRAAPGGGQGLPRPHRSWAVRGGCGQTTTCRTRAREPGSDTPRRCAAEGDEATARMDLRAARTVFERLGATLDLQRVDALLGGGARSPRGLSGASHQDVHVHRHRDLHRPDRPRRRRRLGRAPRVAQPRAPVGLRKPPRRGSPRALATASSWPSRRLPTRSSARSTSSGGWRGIAASTGSRRGCGSASTPPKRRRHGRDYSGRGVHVAARDRAAPHRARRSWPRPTRSRRPARSRFKVSEPRALSLKGVREPVEVRAIDWR